MSHMTDALKKHSVPEGVVGYVLPGHRIICAACGEEHLNTEDLEFCGCRFDD